MRSSSLRRSVGLDETEQPTNETSHFSKKQTFYVIEEEKPELKQKNNWNTEEENMSPNEKNTLNNLNTMNDICNLDFFEQRDSKTEEDLTAILSPVRRVTCDLPKNRQG